MKTLHSVDSPHSRDRRNFIQKLAGLSIAGLLPTTVGLGRSPSNGPPLPDPADNEDYWALVKRQFAVPEGMIMANSANLCPSPGFISDRVRYYQEDLAADVSFQNRAKFAEMRSSALQRLSEFVGASKSEIGITRNTSEGNNIVVNGLDLKRGDEVIIWDQNHPTNNLAWKQRAIRQGFTVKQVTVPENPGNPDELLATFGQAITKNTRVISFSHLSNASGILLPARKICAMASSQGILTLVDGAQAFGAMKLDLHALGCDFYTASTHKWLMGPMENGLLYVKEDRIEELWPDSIAPGWSQDKITADEKFCSLGQRNNATIAAIEDILDFHNQIGSEHIEKRIAALHAHLKSGLKEAIPGLEFITPTAPSMSGGVTLFKVAGKDTRSIYEELYSRHGIASAAMSGVRFSPTIMNTMADMDRLVQSTREVVQS